MSEQDNFFSKQQAMKRKKQQKQAARQQQSSINETNLAVGQIDKKIPKSLIPYINQSDFCQTQKKPTPNNLQPTNLQTQANLVSRASVEKMEGNLEVQKEGGENQREIEKERKFMEGLQGDRGEVAEERGNMGEGEIKLELEKSESEDSVSEDYQNNNLLSILFKHDNLAQDSLKDRRANVRQDKQESPIPQISAQPQPELPSQLHPPTPSIPSIPKSPPTLPQKQQKIPNIDPQQQLIQGDRSLQDVFDHLIDRIQKQVQINRAQTEKQEGSGGTGGFGEAMRRWGCWDGDGAKWKGLERYQGTNELQGLSKQQKKMYFQQVDTQFFNNIKNIKKPRPIPSPNKPNKPKSVTFTTAVFFREFKADDKPSDFMFVDQLQYPFGEQDQKSCEADS